MKTEFLYLLIIMSLLSKILNQNAKEIEVLTNILECLEKDNKKNITEMKNLLNIYNPFNIQKVYIFLQDNLKLVKLCTNDLSDVPKFMRRNIVPFNKQLKRFNWKKYLDCLNQKKKDNSFDPIIGFIKEKNYYNASIEEMKLLQEGNIIAIQCETKKYINITRNPDTIPLNL